MDPRIPEPPGSPSLLRPRGIGEILGDALKLYQRHWRNLIVIVAVIVIPLSIAQILVADLWIRDDTVLVDGGLVAGALLSLVVGITSILMWTVLAGAITRAAAGTFLGRDLDIGDSYRYGLARFWSIVLIGILSALAIVGGFILLVIPGFIVLEPRARVRVAGVRDHHRRGPAHRTGQRRADGAVRRQLGRSRHRGVDRVGRDDAVHGARQRVHLPRPAGPQGAVLGLGSRARPRIDRRLTPIASG
jgi:hypothetical protein